MICVIDRIYKYGVNRMNNKYLIVLTTGLLTIISCQIDYSEKNYEIKNQKLIITYSGEVQGYVEECG